METLACAVGRIGVGGSWVGFVPTIDDGYALVVSAPSGTRSSPATATDLVALALAYFEEALAEPPEELAATHGDIGAIVRHAADLAATGPRGREHRLAVDAVDDGLGADAVIERLAAALGSAVDPIRHLESRAEALQSPG